MTKPRNIVERRSVDKPAQFVGIMTPAVPHPFCKCGYCGQHPHERYHKIVQEVLTDDGKRGAKVLALIIPLN